MAIEPLGSIMSLQAQNTTQNRPVVPAEKSADVTYSEGAASEAQKIDMTLTVVEESKKKDEQNGKSNEQGKEPTKEQLKKAVEQLNSKMADSEAVFGIHEDTNRVTIKIVDKNTKETIKELPPEKTLDMIAKVWEMAGILVDERR